MEWQRDNYLLTDDAKRLDLPAVCALLQSTYWASQRTQAVIEKSLRHSLNFSLFLDDRQAGFARVITDYCTHAYLCDVVMAEEQRGKGVGKWMLRQILDHPDLRGCRIDLFTQDAQEFYRPFGFAPHKFDCLVRYPTDYVGGSEAQTRC